MSNKTTRAFRLALAVAIAVVLVGAAGAGDGRRSVDITERAVLNGTTLEPGQYSVRWDDGDGDGVLRVQFRLRNKLVAEANARVETRERPAAYTAVIFKTDENGKKTPSEIRTRGERDVLVIES